MIKIGAVILNYKSYKDTIECVKSILAQNYENYEIVIVENGSDNNSFDVLSSKFSRFNNVKIINNETNLGFAKGNNIGIRYVHEVLGCDYVFVVNSDIIIGNDLFETISTIEIGNIGVISPTVCNLNGRYQYPTLNVDNIQKTIIKTIKLLYLAILLKAPLIRSLYLIYKKIKKKTQNYNPPLKYNRYAIQGCSYFLTPNFFKYYNQLYPNTFLYWEEINLIYYLDKVGLTAQIVITSPVLHKEKQSTKKLLMGKDIDKYVLKYSKESMYKSIPLFFKDYKEIKKKYDSIN